MFRQELDLFHLYIHDGRNERLTRKETVNMLKQLLVFFFKDLGRLVLALLSKADKCHYNFQGKKVVFANTVNNFEALKFLLQRYSDCVLVCTGGYVRRDRSSINISGLLSTVNFKKYFFLIYLAITPHYRVRHFRLIVKYCSFIDEYVRLFESNKPSCFFISNDHYPDSRALILAAKKLAIKCIYLQHASVTSYFPPMRASHALLYGQYSEDIYSNIKESESKLIQVGNHKFDAYKTWIANKKTTGNIGVAFNTRNSIPDVLAFCEFLSHYFDSERIILRSHPADRRKFHSRFAVSPSKVQSSLDFLKDIDVLVAGNSSLLLEAAAMNVHVFQIYYDKVPDFLIDYYGFIRTGIAIEVKDKIELVQQISLIMKSCNFDSRRRTKIFDASVGAPHEFDVESHIISVVDEILTG